MFTNILLPTDGSEVADRAVDAGVELARQLGAKVTVVTVVRSEELDHDYAAGALAAAAAKAEAAGVPVTKLTRTGEEPADAIVAAAAESGADLIAMASHGRRGLTAVLLGSQTDLVAKQAKIPVLIFR